MKFQRGALTLWLLAALIASILLLGGWAIAASRSSPGGSDSVLSLIATHDAQRQILSEQLDNVSLDGTDDAVAKAEAIQHTIDELDAEIAALCAEVDVPPAACTAS